MAAARSAVLRHGGSGASAQHCTAMNKWPNTIQHLGSDDIMSLDIKSFAAELVGTKDMLRDLVTVFLTCPELEGTL